MFEISALPSLKPAGPVIDQASGAGAEALQISPFSTVFSAQLETQAAAAGAPESAAPDPAALALAADAAGNRQPDGKMLPDGLPVAPEAGATDGEAVEGKKAKPLDEILAGRLQVQTQPAAVKAKPVKGRGESETLPAEAPAPQREDAADDTAQGPVIQAGLPIAMIAMVIPAIPTPIQLSAVPPEAAPDAPKGNAAAAGVVAAVVTAKASAVPGPGKGSRGFDRVMDLSAVPDLAASPAIDATAPQAATRFSAATLAAIALPQPAAKDTPAAMPAAVSTIALVAAQANVAPRPDGAAAQTAPAVAATRLAKPDTLPGKTEDAAETPDAALAVEAPTGRTKIAAKVQVLRLPAAANASQPAEAAASALAAKSDAPADSAAPTAPAAQSTAILTDTRQPVVGPTVASVAPAAPGEKPQDFAALVDRLIAARETSAPQPIQASISHAEFGRVSLNFQQDGGALTVAMTSADPGFAPAVLAAMSADKPAAPNDSPQQTQPQVQAAMATQAQAQTQSQTQSQSQSQQQSQGQQPGGSAQLHQDASGQRGADGSGAQGRSGQERGSRYQSNPSPSARGTDSSQARNGTYA